MTTIPKLLGQDYGRMASAAVALASNDREGLDLTIRDAQASGRSLEFILAPLSIVCRAFDLYDGGPEAVEAFQQRIAHLSEQASGDEAL